MVHAHRRRRGRRRGTGLIAWMEGRLSPRRCRLPSFEATASGTGDDLLDRARRGRLQLVPRPLAGAAGTAATWVGTEGFSPWVVMVAILVFYLLLGCVMDSLSMILLTIPIFFPIVIRAGLRARAGGVRHLVRHPGADRRRGRPDHAAGGHEPVRHPVDGEGHAIRDTYRGVMPFVISDLVRVALLVAFPAITLFVLRF
jgi:C4-dicarboxylate transporter DctM subunit